MAYFCGRASQPKLPRQSSEAAELHNRGREDPDHRSAARSRPSKTQAIPGLGPPRHDGEPRSVSDHVGLLFKDESPDPKAGTCSDHVLQASIRSKQGLVAGLATRRADEKPSPRPESARPGRREPPRQPSSPKPGSRKITGFCGGSCRNNDGRHTRRRRRNPRNQSRPPTRRPPPEIDRRRRCGEGLGHQRACVSDSRTATACGEARVAADVPCWVSLSVPWVAGHQDCDCQSSSVAPR
jgi:hypothetical protein